MRCKSNTSKILRRPKPEPGLSDFSALFSDFWALATVLEGGLEGMNKINILWVIKQDT